MPLILTNDELVEVKNIVERVCNIQAKLPSVLSEISKYEIELTDDDFMFIQTLCEFVLQIRGYGDNYDIKSKGKILLSIIDKISDSE